MNRRRRSISRNLCLSVFICGSLGSPAPGMPESEANGEWGPPRMETTVWLGNRRLLFERIDLSQPSAPDVLPAVYARFDVDGPTPCRIDNRQPSASAEVRAACRGLPIDRRGASLHFTLPGPGQYFVRQGDAGSKDYLLLFADAADEATLRGPWTDVTGRGIRPSETAVQTQAIQALLDECMARSGGGKLRFPPGVYRSGSLRIGSNTRIHLDSGATLKAADDPACFGAEFLLVRDADNVAIEGRGTIDGNALTLRAIDPSVTHRLHGLAIQDSHNVSVSGIMLRNVCDWNVHVLRSDHVKVRDLIILAHKDGLAADSSSDVTFAHCFVQSTDDTSLVCTRDQRPAERILIRNCLFRSLGAAMKIGSLTEAPIRDVTFERCEAFATDRGISIETRNRVAAIQRIRWTDLVVDLARYKEESSGMLLDVRTVEGGRGFELRDCVIENVRANPLRPSRISAGDGPPLSGLVLRHLELHPDPSLGAGRKLFELDRADGVEFESIAIHR